MTTWRELTWREVAGIASDVATANSRALLLAPTSVAMAVLVATATESCAWSDTRLAELTV